MTPCAYPIDDASCRHAAKPGQFCFMHARIASRRAEEQYTFQIGPAVPAPFATRDNGHHLFFEDAEILVACNHGSPMWWGLGKRGGGYAVLSSGENPAVVMAETREGRANMEG